MALIESKSLYISREGGIIQLTLNSKSIEIQTTCCETLEMLNRKQANRLIDDMDEFVKTYRETV